MDPKHNEVAATSSTQVDKPGVAAPERQLETFSFDIDAIRDLRIMRVSTGVVVNPPKPHFRIELTLERPLC